PELIKQQQQQQQQQQSKLSINFVSSGDHFADIHNQNYNSLHRRIENDTFDYFFDSVGVKKINSVYRFYPSESGRMRFDNDMNNEYENIYFVTIVDHKKNLHLTLQE